MSALFIAIFVTTCDTHARYNEGTNDRPNITADFVTVVEDLLKVAPNAKQLLLVPFNGGHKQDINAVVDQIGSPDVTVGDTSGFYNGVDGLHPFGYNHIAEIAPKMAELCLPLISKHAASSNVTHHHRLLRGR